MSEANTHARGLRLAWRLRRASCRLPEQGLTLRELADLHGPAAPGSLLILLAAPCLLPIPGVGTVLGLSLLTLAAGLWRGRSHHGLPERVAHLNLSADWARRVLRVLAQCHGATEGWVKARMGPGATNPGQRWLSAIVALMAVLIVLPIPFGNFLPALSLMLAGLAITARDGLALMASYALAALSTAFGVGVSLLGLFWGGELLGWLGNWLTPGLIS